MNALAQAYTRFPPVFAFSIAAPSVARGWLFEPGLPSFPSGDTNTPHPSATGPDASAGTQPSGVPPPVPPVPPPPPPLVVVVVVPPPLPQS